jgi:Zn-dependent protease with chaperone function
MAKKLEAVEFTCGQCGAVNRLPWEKVLHLSGSPQCGKCDNSLLSAFDKSFEDLDPATYTHPLDKESLEALKRIPGVNTLLRSLIRHSFELATRLHHHANFVRIGPEQFASLWEKFEFAGSRLGIEELPELYVYQDPVPNAYTFGVDKNFVAVSTGCLELLEDDEILCVLAHELGHVHADHVLFKSAARVFGSVASTIVQATLGVGSLVVYPIQIALLRWDRASELSCDRAALLVVRNPHTVLSTLMKVAGGTQKHKDELNINAFIEQADSFGKMQDEGPLGRYITIFQTLFRSHPFPIWRAKELMDWVSGGSFLEVMDGDYEKRVAPPEKACVSCGKDIRMEATICAHCGASQQAEPQVGPDDPVEEDPLKRTWRDVTSWYKRNFTMDGGGDDAGEGPGSEQASDDGGSDDPLEGEIVDEGPTDRP